MRSMLRYALESDGDLDAAILEDDKELLELEANATEAIRDAQVAQQSLEALNSYKYVIEQLLANKTYSFQTANVVCAEALTISKGMGYEITLPSLESDSDESVRLYHEKALEGIVSSIRNIIDNGFQLVVITIKNVVDSISDVFKKVEPKLLKYEGYLDETMAEFTIKRRHFRSGKHHLSLVELWHFFSNAHGPLKEFIPGLDFDTQASEFILDQYPQSVLNQISKSISIIKSESVRNELGAIRFIESFSSFKNPEDLFNTEYIGQGLLLNAVNISRSPGKVKKAYEFGGKKLSHIADISTHVKLSESTSISHTAAKAGAATTSIVFGPIAAAVTNTIVLSDVPPIEVSTEEIGDIITLGKKYTSNVRKYLRHQKDFESKANEFISLMERKHSDDNNYGLDDEKLEVFKNVYKQLLDFVENNISAFTQPCLDEVKRSIRGAKYSNYLAKRLIWNAKPYL